MFRSLESLGDYEKDLVNGYYRSNSHKYIIPNVVIRLSMLYLWVLDAFTLPKSQDDSKVNKDINNEELDSDIIVIGLNHTVIKCENGGITSFVLGKNIISSKNTYHHWRFKIINEGVFDDGKSYNFIVGILNDKNNGYTFIGSHGLKSSGLTEQFTIKRFKKRNDICDMYLDFNHGQLSFIVNNESLGIAFKELDINKEYKMTAALTNKESELELISYHSCKGYTQNEYKLDELECINYIRCIFDVEEKIKYLEILIKRNIIYNVCKNEVYNEYIDCLMIKQEFNKCYDFIQLHDFKINIENIGRIGKHFYFNGHNEFEKALNMFKLLKNDENIMDQHVSVETAYCYEQHGKNHKNDKNSFLNAIKYYKLGLEYEKKLGNNARNECLHHMGALYFNYICDYKSALNCFLEMGDEEINNRHLESVIASCYDQIKENEQAIKYFKKYQTKFPNKPSAIIAIATLYGKCNKIEKADEWFKVAFNLNNSDRNWMIHTKYGYYLLNSKKDYNCALKYFIKSLNIANSDHERGESYKCIGATYDKLGDMDNAIFNTDKVLELNGNDADALNNAGYFYLVKRQYEKAYNYLMRSLDIFPDGDLTTGNIGICLYEMGKYEQCIPYLKKVIYELPIDLAHIDVGPRSLHCYAEILFKQKNDYKGAQETLIKLLKHQQFEKKYKSNKDEVYYLMSRIYSKLMNFQQSLKYLKMARSVNPYRDVYENQIQILQNTMFPDFDAGINLNGDEIQQTTVIDIDSMVNDVLHSVNNNQKEIIIMDQESNDDDDDDDDDDDEIAVNDV